MKSLTYKEKSHYRIEVALRKLITAEQLIPLVESVFELASKELPLAVPYETFLVEAEKLRYKEFYQTGPRLGKYAIKIAGVKHCSYLWRDTGEWVLDGEFYAPTDIAEKLCETPIFNEVPENVKDLKYLLCQGSWRYMPGIFPKFGGVTPEDEVEVLSWDPQNVLVGTRLENIEVVSRDEWQNILFRESDWFS